MSDSFIHLQNVRKVYRRGREEFLAISDASFDVMPGELVSLVGPSGCGKSTLLKILAGLHAHDGGEVRIGSAGHSFDPSKDIGMVFQAPLLLKWRKILENVLLPAEILGLPMQASRNRARDLLALVGLSGFEDKYPYELSGGMQQRAAIARALVHDPKLVLMDEPFGALDALTREKMNLELLRIWKEAGKTIIFVTHGISEAVFLGTRVVVLTAGPAKMADNFEIDLAFPRTLDMKTNARFGEYTRRIYKLLEWNEMGPYAILYGDIHNHNAHGYGVGSIERSLDIARTHLDFFAFTGHSSWHDMPAMEGGRERHWIDGFKRLKDTWPRVQQVIAEGNRDGEFCAFLGFEWHSSQWGDQCVVFPEDHRPLFYAAEPEKLRRFCNEERALMIPHHLAYPKGHRGVNWDAFREDCTPVVEIFSEHGNSEHDRGPYAFTTHSMGGRETANTARAALDAGKRFGFVASSDDHAGFPGAYGEGLMAALATDLSRPAILDAVRARRTYALTGDRIEVDFTVEGAPMGATIEAGHEVQVAFDVRGRDELDVVEIVQDGRIVHRAYAEEVETDLRRPLQVRLEWGWGPWGALALERICDWVMRVQLSAGRIARFFPCLSSMPFDERRRHRFERTGDAGLSIRSYTSRRDAYRENPNQSVVLELDADSSATLALKLIEPVEQETSVTLADLARGSKHAFTGPFPKEGWQWHRLVPLSSSAVAGRCTLPVPRNRSYVYLRARQKNGHMAWASPVFLNYR